MKPTVDILGGMPDYVKETVAMGFRNRKLAFETLSPREMLSASHFAASARMISAHAPAISAPPTAGHAAMVSACAHSPTPTGSSAANVVANHLAYGSALSIPHTNTGVLTSAHVTHSLPCGGTATLMVSSVPSSGTTTTNGATLILNSDYNRSIQTGSLNLGTALQGGTVNIGGVNTDSGGTGTVNVVDQTNLGGATAITVNGGTLRFNNTSGAATIGSGVTAAVSTGATLELAGTVPSLGTIRLTSNGNQQVGAIDGTGATQVNLGADLTANQIVQGALVIDGVTAPGLLTINSADSSGNPLTTNGLSLAGSLTTASPFALGSLGSSSLLAPADSSAAAV